MLPPTLGELKATLERKGPAKRSAKEDSLLAELTEIDQGLDRAKRDAPESTKSIEKRGGYNPGVLGSPPNTCPICGK